MDSNTRIYLFDDPIKFLAAELKRLKQEEKRFSLREWSRRLGYENPSYFSDVLKGKRKLKISLAILIASSLKLDERATRYLELMTLIHQTREVKEKRHLAKLLNSMRPQELKNSTSLSMEQFALIADWHNWALIEMPALKDFRSDVKSIVKRLGGKVSQEAVGESLELLVKYKLLERNAEGGIVRRSSSEPTVLEPEVSRAAVREYQRQMAKKAIEALERQKSEELDFQGTTFAFRTADLPELKRIVREFHQRILTLSQTEEADEIYQFNSQFFRLT
jgi:uncharacterized protein (TIGR02147 family)